MAQLDPVCAAHLGSGTYMAIKKNVICEAKPTTLKRPSSGDGFENHMYYTKTCGSMKCNFHLSGHPHHLRS